MAKKACMSLKGNAALNGTALDPMHYMVTYYYLIITAHAQLICCLYFIPVFQILHLIN